MNKMKKTAISVFAVALIGSTLPLASCYGAVSVPFLTASADETESTAVYEDGVLTLRGNVDKAEVRALLNDKSIKNSITRIECENGAVLPDDCSSLFFYCKASVIDLSAAQRSKVKKVESMFYECSNLKSLDISCLDISEATSTYQMFGDCSKLESLDVSGLDTSNVTDMSWMFHNCRTLKELDVTMFNTSSCKSFYEMFADCTGLTSIDLSSLDTSAATTTSHMFSGCTGLTSIDLSGFNTSCVNNMYGMFHNCSSLTSLDVSALDTSSVTSMVHMFSGCSKLTELDLSTFNTVNVNKMEYLFSGCKKLEKLDLGGLNTSNVESMYQMFGSCESLESLDLSDFNTPKLKDTREMFSSCKKLSSLDLSGFNTENVTNMRCMFNDCWALKKLDLRSFNTANVTEMDCMFRRCSALEELDISSFNTENVTDMGFMFIACLHLDNIDLSHFDMKKVTSGSAMLGGCNALAHKMIHTVSASSSIDGSITLNYTIKPCEDLAKIVLSGPNGNKEITDFFAAAQDDGTYKLSYELKANQSYSSVKLNAYDKEGNSLIVVNSNDILYDHCTADLTLDNYLDKLNTAAMDQNLKDLVSNLRTYCVVAGEYFDHTPASYDYPTITDEELDQINDLAMNDETGACKISLVLHSRTSIRIYYDGKENEAREGAKVLKAQKSQYGKYFEITDINPESFRNIHTITIGGKKVSFCALSYIQKVLAAENPDGILKNLCRQFYAYGRAAENYKASLQEV